MTTATPTRPPMDPRLRDRRVAVIRAQGRRRLRVLVVAFVLLVVAGGVGLVAFSPVLDVDRIDVSGVEGDRAQEVADAAGIDVGDPVLLVDPGDASRALEALPWVDDARIERELPGTVRIEVTERVLVGWAARPEGGVALIDAEGRVLADAVTAPAGLPEITGVRELPGVGASIRPPAGAQALGALPPELLARSASIRVQRDRVTLVLADGPEVRLGEATELETKGRVALAVLATLDAPITYLDVEVPSVPVTG